MKPNEIDSIIRSKLQENDSFYDHEIAAAKPFIWAAIRNKITRTGLITWHHLAAAMVLLFVVFSFIFNSLREEHQRELDVLSDKIDQLQKINNARGMISEAKETQIASLDNQLRYSAIQLDELTQESPTEAPTILYHTDTVYINTVELIPTVAEINTHPDHYQAYIESVPVEILKPEMDDVIYPDFYSQGSKQPTETINFKFGPFTARKD